MKWYILAIKNYATFTGRARRKEFWMFVLFNIIFGLVAKLLDDVFGLSFDKTGMMNGGILNMLYSLFVLVPTLSLTVRRFHDIGKSGWIYFRFVLVSIIATIIWITIVVVKLVQLGVSLDPEDIDFTMLKPAIVPTLVYGLTMLVVGVWSLILMVRDSQPGTNKYGPNPKEAEDFVQVSE